MVGTIALLVVCFVFVAVATWIGYENGWSHGWRRGADMSRHKVEDMQRFCERYHSLSFRQAHRPDDQ